MKIKKRKLFRTIVVLGGLFFAVVPIFAVHFGLNGNAQNRGDELVQSIAATMVKRADANVSRAMQILSEFALLGVASCDPLDLAAMRRAVSAQFVVREIGIVDRNQKMVCNQYGEGETFEYLAAGIANAEDKSNLQLVRRSGSRENQIMISWPLASGNRLVAFLPGEALADDVIPERMRGKGVALVTMSDGTMLYMAPSQRTARAVLPFDRRTFSVTVTSPKYPYRVAVLAPFDVVWDDFSGLYRNLMIGAAALFVVLVGFVISFLRRKRGRANEIEEGIENGEFIPYYQPTLNIETGELAGCEVLIRWQKPDGQVLSPGSFIGLAEATGLAIPMTRALMEKVAEEMSDLHEKRPALKIGINLFDDHFENLDIVEDIKSIFGGTHIKLDQLIFEVTERQPLTDIERARVVMKTMREFGCRVALDDAGTGHGGLAYLQQLGFDIIKIDKLFVDAIGTDSLSAPIVDSLISLAEGLELEVVAEGVEDPRQVQYLREKGVKLAQGFLFAKPLPYEKYKRLIEKMMPVSQNPEERRRASLNAQFRADAAA
ncbi:MAG: EAL domain-containing protein [Pseudomonadota bacterium]